MSVTDIKAEELRQKGGEEGIVFQGCGGDAKDWVDGVNQLLKDKKILLDGTKLTPVFPFRQREVGYGEIRYMAVEGAGSIRLYVAFGLR